MSHAANLRSRQRSSDFHNPAKRRKISPTASTSKVNGITALVNGAASARKLAAIPTFNAKRQVDDRPDVIDAVVSHGQKTVDTDMLEESSESVDESEDEASSSEDEDAMDDVLVEEEELRNGHLTPPEPSEKAGEAQDAADSDQHTEPSFGDLLRAQGPQHISVEASFPGEAATPKALAVNTGNRALTIPSATSLGTVLTQALKTNDVDLLESCLQVPSLESIRATVQRLHSSLATTLLQRLAERLHKRPGRAGSLMVWVQWTVVAHGGYLASQPAAVKQLRTLYQVVKQRATGLQPLLALKGRLDMLEAQMQMRRNLQERSRGGAVADVGDTTVVYVEDEEERSSDEEVDAEGGSKSTTGTATSKKSLSDKRIAGLEIPATDEEDEDMPSSLPNGIDATHDEDDDGESGSSEEEGDLIDDEAEETDNDSDALSEEIDYDDADGIGGSSESEEEERPAKRSTASQRNTLRRR